MSDLDTNETDEVTIADSLGVNKLKVYTDGSITSRALVTVIPSVLNNSSSNLAVGATFTGASESTINVSGIQFIFNSDQDGVVYVDQSGDGTNWDVIDHYDFYVGKAALGVTVQAVGSYFRIRVTNSGTATTTFLRLQTVLCPVIEALPRSLDDNGNLKTAVNSISDGYGFNVENTPMGEMRVVEPVRLTGATFQGTTVDPNFWTTSVVPAGTVTQTDGNVVLATGTTASGSATIQSVRAGRYVGGSSNRFRCAIEIVGGGVTSNTRRWGVFTTTDGAFFQISGTVFSVVTRKSSVDTVVSNGSFNGVLGSTLSVSANVTNYEIYYTNSKVYFVIGEDIVHTVSTTSGTWTSQITLPIRLENTNGAITTNVTLECRVASIFRLGLLQTETQYGHITTNTTTVLKYGAGRLHRIVRASGGTLVIYDNTAGTGTVIHTVSGTTPVGSIEYGIPFFNGLTVVSTLTPDALIVYE